MKSISLKKILAFTFAAIMTFSLCACNNYDEMTSSADDEFYLTKEAEMDEATKAELTTISDAFENFLLTGDTSEVKKYMDPDFGATDEQLSAFSENYKAMGVNPFTVYDSYYIKDVKPEDVTRKFKKSAEAEFGVEVTPGSSEMYLVLYASENEKISHMVSLLCAKDNDWKIVWIDASDFKYKGADARAVYDETSRLYDEGNFLAAYTTSLKLNLIMRPGNALVHNTQMDMQDIYYKIQSDFQKSYPLPYSPEITNGSVKLHALALAKEDGEIVPLMVLESNLALSDVDALRTQAQQVLSDLDGKSPGFSDYFDAIAVNVYNVDPNTAETQPEMASFILK